MRKRIPRTLAATDSRLFLWLLFGLMTATTVSSTIATGIVAKVLF